MQRRPLILISDDEPLLVRSLGREARAVGFDVIVDTCSEVLTLARAHRPDVIVLDLRQDVDGRDLLASLKRDPETRGLKVVVLSGVEDPYTRKACLELGAWDFSVKPVPPTFLTRLARLLGTRSDVDPAEPPAPGSAGAADTGNQTGPRAHSASPKNLAPALGNGAATTAVPALLDAGIRLLH